MLRPESLAVSVILTALVAFGAISTDLYLPSLPAIARDFSSDAAGVQLTLSVFLIAFAIGQLVYGPLSDRFGRRPMLLFGLALYVAASLACLFAAGIEMLIAARFAQALGAASGVVLGRTVVRDVHGREGAARVLSYIAMAMALAPALGPILGGYLQSWFGWRANFLALSLFGGATLIAVAALLPETVPERDPTATRPRRLLANFASLARHEDYRAYVMITACAYAGIFAFISGSAFVLIETLGLSPELYGVSFAVMVAGYMLGTFLSGRLTLRLGLERLVAVGALVGLLGGGAMAALSAAGVLTLWAILAPVFVFTVGAGLMLPNALAGALGPFPLMAGAASSLMGFVQMTFAALVGVAVGQLHDGTGRNMAFAIGAVGLAALLTERLLLRKSRRFAAQRCGPPS